MRKEIPLMLLSALLGVGARAGDAQPLSEQAPEAHVYAVDAQGSEVLVYVRSKGRAAQLGTNHVVQVNGLEGEVWLRHPIQDSSLRLWFPVQALRVDDPELRNAPEITYPSGLPYRPSSALRQQLHRPGYAPVVAP